MRTKLRIKRIYEPPEKTDGYRVLVDRLWPRGISKERAAVDVWLKKIAPTPGLRLWFGHDPDKWAEFRNKYLKELKANKIATDEARNYINAHDVVTLLYAAKDPDHNHALVLKELLKFPNK